jgi:hypothetical protein
MGEKEGSFPLHMGIELGEIKEGMQIERTLRGPICHIMGAEVDTSVNFSSLLQRGGRKAR